MDRSACTEVVSKVNNLVRQQEEGRLFAVVHLCGKQYKVTSGDIIVIEGYWAPTIGDEVKLEKVGSVKRQFPSTWKTEFSIFSFSDFHLKF